MKIIEQNIYNALSQRKDFKHGRDTRRNVYRDIVEIHDDGYEVVLWGHIIAEKKGHRITLCDCGWNTSTTASRLNVVCRFENLPVYYSWGKGGRFEDRDGNEYKSGHIVWDCSENRIVEE